MVEGDSPVRGAVLFRLFPIVDGRSLSAGSNIVLEPFCRASLMRPPMFEIMSGMGTDDPSPVELLSASPIVFGRLFTSGGMMEPVPVPGTPSTASASPISAGKLSAREGRLAPPVFVRLSKAPWMAFGRDPASPGAISAGLRPVAFAIESRIRPGSWFRAPGSKVPVDDIFGV